MAIITFWSNGKEQTGKTLSMAAISTYMAIEHNVKILMVSTSNKEETLYNCFFEKNKRRSTAGMFAPRQGNLAIDTGMSGLVKMAKSNKVAPDMIKNYTKAIFKDTLEILFSGTTGSYKELEDYYPEIIRAAGQFYDYVFVDLDANINDSIQTEILKNSNLIVANINQKLSSVNTYIEEKQASELLSSKKTITLIGRYDKFSKYSAKNISRYIGERTIPITIPYNTLFYDSAEEAKIPDLFLSFAKNKNLDKEDRNYIFIEEVKRAENVIQYRLQELQMRV